MIINRRKSIVLNLMLFLLIQIGCFLPGNAQTGGDGQPQEYLVVKTETTGTFTAGDNAPFWITSNTYGVGWYHKNNQYVRTGLFAAKNLSDKVSLSAGADFFVANQLESEVAVQQLYMDLNYGKFCLSMGQKERLTPFRNNALSTGGMTLSNNARPVPQVEFSFPDFVAIPYSNQALSFRGGVSYGWYIDNSFRKKTQNGEYLRGGQYHRKYLFVKIGKPASSAHLIAGIEGGTQWGGDRYSKGERKYSNPSSLRNMLRVTFNRSGGGGAHWSDQDNKLGDSYGSYHLVYNQSLKNGSGLRLYYEHYFEDRSGMEFANFPDGTYGVEYNFNRKKLVSTLLFEHVYTKNQSGPPKFDENGLWVDSRGGDNYYNNSIYVSNQHHGFLIGNPLLGSPYYNKGRNLNIHNNRIVAFHLGAAGWLSNWLQYKFLCTHSRGYGTYGNKYPHPKNDVMVAAEFLYENPKLKGWIVSGTIGFDHSTNYVGDNLGVQLKLGKTFRVR